MISALKHRFKELFLDAESRSVRFILDQFLRRRAGARIGLTDSRRVHAAVAEPLQKELGQVLSFSSEFETELYVRRFEVDFARICQRKYAVGTHSGTAALQLTLAALDIGPGDEVVTVPYTYVATALAISNTGATPVFVDIDDSTFNMDPNRLEAAITSRTKAILPVHLYGQVANMSQIMQIAAAHDLPVIEDACQAFGAERHGRKAGSFGRIGCFSFSTPKSLGGFGNGGMVVTDDKRLIDRIRALRNPESNHPVLRKSGRTPCYLDAIQIAFLRAKLPLIDSWIDQRRAQAERYRYAWAGLDVKLPLEADGARHTYYRFALRTRQRAALRQWLNRAGIRAVASYSPCLHQTATFADLGHGPGAFPNAEAAAREAILVPLSPFFETAESQRIIDRVQRFFLRSTP